MNTITLFILLLALGIGMAVLTLATSMSATGSPRWAGSVIALSLGVAAFSLGGLAYAGLASLVP